MTFFSVFLISVFEPLVSFSFNKFFFDEPGVLFLFTPIDAKIIIYTIVQRFIRNHKGASVAAIYHFVLVKSYRIAFFLYSKIIPLPFIMQFFMIKSRGENEFR